MDIERPKKLVGLPALIAQLLLAIGICFLFMGLLFLLMMGMNSLFHPPADVLPSPYDIQLPTPHRPMTPVHGGNW